MISKSNTRTQLTIPITVKTELMQIAASQNRSFNNLLLTIILDWLKEYKDGR